VHPSLSTLPCVCFAHTRLSLPSPPRTAVPLCRCYGPAYWDDSFGPKPPGLVGAINEQIRKRFFEGYVAPPPPPSPPFDCDCSWTDKFPCPGTQPGERALKQAKDDGSACFHHCCPPLNLVDHVDLNPNAYYDHEPASAA